MGEAIARRELLQITDVMQRPSNALRDAARGNGKRWRTKSSSRSRQRWRGACRLGDEQRRTQVLLNLVGNALQFTDTEVRITARSENEPIPVRA
jgi:signal transduction histidine kinase